MFLSSADIADAKKYKFIYNAFQYLIIVHYYDIHVGGTFSSDILWHSQA